MGNDSIIYIRTDGNSEIATGHLVRCLCIAEVLENLNQKICFLVSDNTSKTLLYNLATSIFDNKAFSFSVQILKKTAYNNMEAELPELQKLLSKENCSVQPPILLIDSYFVTPHYLDSLNQLVRVAYIDDLRSFDYSVTLVINYDVIPPSLEAEYALAYTKASQTLLGAQYAPLRKQFQNQDVIIKDKLKHILITTGGGDPYHFTEQLLSYLFSLEYTFHVVIGPLFTQKEHLIALSKKHPNIILHENVSDMAVLMKQCDFAISTAGTTLYELCALGIPSVSITMADNQIHMAKTFCEMQAVPYSGDIRTEKEKVLTFIYNILTDYTENPHKRLEKHTLMRQLTDGNGAWKIAKVLCNL